MLNADFPMRLTLFLFLSLILSFAPARAQSVMDNLPPLVIQGESSAETPPVKEDKDKDKETPPVPSDPYTVADVNADVTADTAAHARDQALMQAEKAAYAQLCERLNAVDNSAKLSEDDIAELVQSFEVQSERLSAVRYIGVFTIRFNPSMVQKNIVISAVPVKKAETPPPAPVTHMTVAVQADSLAAWLQIKKRLGAVPQVAKIDTLDLGRGLIHIDLSYSGSLDDLKQAATNQGLVIRQNGSGIVELYDGSMISR
jgi:hypothetical protein